MSFSAKSLIDLQYTCGAAAEQKLKDMCWLNPPPTPLLLPCIVVPCKLFCAIPPAAALLVAHAFPPQLCMLHVTVGMCRHSAAQ